MAMNPADAYLDNKIRTASSADLVLMLYEGAIKFCNIASKAIDENDILKANKNIIKAENIVVELRMRLDFKHEVANEFDRLYDYIYRRMVEANIKKDKEILEEATEHLRDMRNIWKEIMKKS